MEIPILIQSNPIITKHSIIMSTLCLRKMTITHSHNYIHIWYALAGSCVHTLGDTTFTQTPGTCVIIPPHMPHKLDTSFSEETPVILCISFSDEFFTSRGRSFCSYYNNQVIFLRYGLPLFTTLTEEDRKKTDKLARSMLSEFSGYSKPVLDKISDLLANFLRPMCVRLDGSLPSETFLEQVRIINSAIKYMEKHYREKVTLADLCNLTALSHYGFTKKFKEITGFTAMEYLHLLRLARTRHLLIFTEKSLSKIAEEVGFYDKSRLIHAFREYTGLSPSEFRKQERPNSYQDDFDTKKSRDFLRDLDLGAEKQN